MKKKYKKPVINSIKIDKKISVHMMSEETPPGGPFSENNNIHVRTIDNPYKV